MSELDTFRQIVRDAVDAEQAAPCEWDLMRHGATLIDHVRAHPASRSEFAKEFVALVEDETFSPGAPFIEFCMHELRWNEVRAEIDRLHSQAIAKPDWRAEPYFRHLTEAFNEDWPDADDIYASYFRQG